MKVFFSCLFIFCVYSTIYSQVSDRYNGIYTITFTDDSKFVINEFVNPEKLPVRVGDIKIYDKTVRGILTDFGEPSFSISKNTIAAIAKKNKLLASQIKNQVYIGIAIKQDENNIIRIHGFKSVNNLKQLSACHDSEKICQVEGKAILVQIKMKDKTENFVLLKSLKPL